MEELFKTATPREREEAIQNKRVQDTLSLPFISVEK